MPNPSAVFFDLDETLADNVVPIPELFGLLYAEFNDQIGNREAFFKTLRPRAGELWRGMFTRPGTPEQQLAQCFGDSIKDLGRHSPTQSQRIGEDMLNRFCQLSANSVQLESTALSTLQSLQSAGVVTGIITNGIEQIQRSKIRALGLDQQVDHIIVSAEAQAHKPDSAVFKLALKRAGVLAREAWQVGDHATNDVAGAIRAGMQGIFYDPTGQRRNTAFSELDVTPSFVISSLAEVFNLLD